MNNSFTGVLKYFLVKEVVLAIEPVLNWCTSLLAWFTGLGKTIVAASLCRSYFDVNRTTYIL